MHISLQNVWQDPLLSASLLPNEQTRRVKHNGQKSPIHEILLSLDSVKSVKGCFFSESMMHFSLCQKNVPKTFLN
jgi:hypothetical protein